MDFYTSLLKSYEEAEKSGLVGKTNGQDSVILPIFHDNLKSDGSNIVNVKLDNNGVFKKAEFVENEKVIVFPVTEKSISRSGQKPVPHPLVDKLQYMTGIDPSRFENYKVGLNVWYENVKFIKVKKFLKLIIDFIDTKDFLTKIVESLYSELKFDLKGHEVTYFDENDKRVLIDLSSKFVTFEIIEFDDELNVSVTTNTELHKDYIEYVKKICKPNGTCLFSGSEDYILRKHRGLLGRAKLVSVSNNKETYYGRFKTDSDIVKIGYTSSEKIHLMLKYLLENTNSRVHLAEQQYLINWFSSDISNATGLNLLDIDSLFYEINEQDEYIPVTLANKKVSEAFYTGNKKVNDDDSYFVAIVDKANNGRLSIKYFKKLSVSSLLSNLNKWQEENSWWIYNTEQKELIPSVPNNYQLITSTFGVERNGKFNLDNKAFKKTVDRKLITHIIEGRSIPSDFILRAEINIRNRSKYKTTWNRLLFVSLSILNNSKGGSFSHMINEKNIDRSYLYGRLLAIYERIEGSTYDSENFRVTNAEKFWTSFTNNPAVIMLELEGKSKSYEKKLRANPSTIGLYRKLLKEKNNIINLINEHVDKNDQNKALDYQFIFGYYAELNFIYTKQEKNSEGNVDE